MTGMWRPWRILLCMNRSTNHGSGRLADDREEVVEQRGGILLPPHHREFDLRNGRAEGTVHDAGILDGLQSGRNQGDAGARAYDGNNGPLGRGFVGRARLEPRPLTELEDLIV